MQVIYLVHIVILVLMMNNHLVIFLLGHLPLGSMTAHGHRSVAMNSNQAVVTVYSPKIIITLYVGYLMPSTVLKKALSV